MIRSITFSLALTVCLSLTAASTSGYGLAEKAHNQHAADRSGVKHVTPRSGDVFEWPGLKPSHSASAFSRQHNFGQALNSVKVRRAAGQTSPIRAAVLFSRTWDNSVASYGLYEFPTDCVPEAPVPVAIGGDEWYAISGATYAGNKYFSANTTTEYDMRVVSYTIFNTQTWKCESVYYGTDDFQALDMAYDLNTGNVYGAFMDMKLQSYVFGSLNVDNGQVTMIKDLGRGTDSRWAAVAIDGGGQLYALSSTGNLLKVDKQTGFYSVIGDTGLKNRYLTSGAIDPVTGAMYFALCTDHENVLYKIDTASATATKLYDLPGGEQLVGMYVDVPLAADQAPAAVKDVKLEFNDDSLTGDVKFTMPSTTFNGEQASGPIGWIIKLNGETAATGNASYGAEVSAQLSVAAAGAYTVSVFASNASGQSPVAKADKWIGKDVPAAVQNVTLTYSDGNFTVEWQPAGPAHNAYFEPDKVTYTVTRMPEGKVVSTGEKATSLTDAVSRPDERVDYYYSVVAVYEGKSSAAALSNKYPLGPIVPPFTETFDTQASLFPYTILNANNDDNEWEWFSGRVRLQYNLYEDADDWLILPPAKLEAGKAYILAFEASCYNSSYPERVAAYAGAAPTAEAMTTQIVAPTEIAIHEGAMQLNGVFAPETSGEYYFGIHGCSEKYRYYLYVDNVEILAPIDASSPSAVTDLVVTPDEGGVPKAVVTFTAPATDVARRELDAISKVELLRDGKFLTNLEAAPGQPVSYTDNNATNGEHTYTVAAYAGDIRGLEATATAYVGNDAPVAPQNLIIRKGSGEGSVTLDWDAVTVDVRGRLIPQGNVTYSIVRYMGQSEKVIKTGLTGCTYTDYPLDDDDDQMFTQYAVVATVGDLMGKPAVTEMYPVGQPYGLPFGESFAGMSVNHIWATGKDSSISTALWELVTSEDVEIQSVDGDGVMLAFTSSYYPDAAVFYSGKIAIPAGCRNPQMSMYVYYFEDGENSFEIRIDSGDGFKTEKTFVAGGFDGWERVSVPLDKYAGKTIRIALKGITGNYNMTLFDDIRLRETLDNNLCAGRLSAPESAVSNEELTLTASLENIGLSSATGYKVNLYRNNELVSSVDGPEVAAGKRVSVSLTDVIGSVVSETAEYFFEVDYAADGDRSDNRSGAVTVNVKFPAYPGVTALTASESEDGVKLEWIGPDFDNMPFETITESFEDYDNLAYTGVGDWTLLDCDKLPAGGISGIDLPGVYEQPVPFFVMDGSEYDNTFAANTGSKMMCSMWVYGTVTKVDDWMISPRLNGSAQTVSFFARCYDPEYPEMFEMLYSKGGTEVDDFVKIASQTVSANSWQRFSAELPDGAEYFAIRCVSDNCFMLFVDDVTYIPAGAERLSLEFKGYNVYRNGQRLNTEPLQTTAFTDITPLAAKNSYMATVVWGEGESAPSDIVTLDLSGLDTAGLSALSIRAEGHEIVVEGAEGRVVTVTAPDGKTLFNGIASGVTRIGVDSGIYIVAAGRNVVKLHVH